MKDIATTAVPQTETVQPSRQSDRIRYAFRLRIAGLDSALRQYLEQAYTEVVTRDGGLIVAPVSLVAGAELILERDQRKARARVVGQVGIRNEYFLYGIQFTEPGAEDFWGINFPSASSTSDAGRTVLQCTKCGRQELLHLGEVDIMVLEQTASMPHQCPACKLDTLWNRPALLGDPNIVTGSDAYQLHSTASFSRSRNTNDRKFARLSMKNIRACLQRPDLADDVVRVLDISRGGIRFLSLIDYSPGTRVMVSVPYTAGGANVFLPARIARVKCRPTIDIPGEFGLAYEKR